MRMMVALCALMCVTMAAGELDATQAAAKKASAYLVAQQNADGTFGKGRETPMPGVVGLVLQSLIHGPEKLTEANSPAVKKGVAYIVSKQQESGAFALPKFGLENYNTAFAVMALAPLNNPEYAPKLQKAKAYLLTCQYLSKRDDAGFGSFGYSPGGSGDLSNTAYALDALTALSVPTTDDVWKNAMIFVRHCQDSSETNDIPAMQTGANSGGFVYRPQSSSTIERRGGGTEKFVPKAYGSMSFEGYRLLALSLKEPEQDRAFQASRKWIANNFSVTVHPGVTATSERNTDQSGYFYYIYGMTKALAERGQTEITLADGKKVRWAAELAKHLMSMQKSDGSFVNSSGQWMENSPILATSYALSAFNECAKQLK